MSVPIVKGLHQLDNFLLRCMIPQARHVEWTRCSFDSSITYKALSSLSQMMALRMPHRLQLTCYLQNSCLLLLSARHSSQSNMIGRKPHTFHDTPSDRKHCHGKASCGHTHKDKASNPTDRKDKFDSDQKHKQRSSEHDHHSVKCESGHCGHKHKDRGCKSDTRLQAVEQKAKLRDGSCPVQGRCLEGSSSNARPKGHVKYFGNYWYGNVERSFGPSDFPPPTRYGWDRWNSGFSNNEWNASRYGTGQYGGRRGIHGYGGGGNWWL